MTASWKVTPKIEANRKVAKFQKPFYIYVTELYNCFDMMRDNVK